MAMKIMPQAGILIREDGRRCDWIGKDAFVPAEPHRFLHTDRSVLVAACSTCGAKIGHPCIGKTGLIGGTHHRRRDKAKETAR